MCIRDSSDTRSARDPKFSAIRLWQIHRIHIYKHKLAWCSDLWERVAKPEIIKSRLRGATQAFRRLEKPNPHQQLHHQQTKHKTDPAIHNGRKQAVGLFLFLQQRLHLVATALRAVLQKVKQQSGQFRQQDVYKRQATPRCAARTKACATFSPEAVTRKM